MKKRTILGLSAWLAVSAAHAQSGLWVDVGPDRSPGNVYAKSDAAVRQLAINLSRLTQRQRDSLIAAGVYKRSIPFSVPSVVRLAQNGAALPPVSRGPGDITLVFDTTGPRVFPAAYQAQLQAAFDKAQATLNVVFGQPASGGNVYVRNYDADISDRDAVSGGYFLPNNGSNQPEIRFPVYTNPEAATVNFIHCLLLAYLGPKAYGFDAFQEGITRAATMKVVRTAGALPATLDPAQIESVLDNTYDVSPFYDWYNQRALGAKQFVANNLRSVALPPGGSLGGIYLLRYEMAGTAWQKLVAENAGFLKEFNRRFYLQPAAASDTAQLVAIGQAALDTVKGATNSTVEGLTFAQWFRRQFILETKDTLGAKLLVQPVPIVSGLGGTDFGVFDVSATYFESQVGSNEILLSGTASPIFWDQTYNRIFPSAQEDSMPIAGAYGSVTPNIPDLNGGVPYRCAVDIPVSGRIARAYIPVGSIATTANPNPNNLYGTVIGQNLPVGATLAVRAFVGATQIASTPVRNGAFGVSTTSGLFTGYSRVRLDVVQTAGSTVTTLLTRYVNKGPGSLAVDLRVGGDTIYNSPTGLLKGIQMVGFPIDPFASTAGDLLGINESDALIARYNPTTVSYDLYPDCGAVTLGNGYFFRMNSTGSFSIPGRMHPRTPIAVAMKPGWNLITNPLNENVVLGRVQVVKSAQSPLTYAEARGLDIGNDFFAFQRGAVDPATGAPETGTMVAGTQFEPGKAYYVRVLAPEGVTMVFFPSTTPSKPSSPMTPTGWRVKAYLNVGTSHTEAVFGLSNTATNGFDVHEDSAIPPRIGGLQMYIAGVESQFRDIRRINTAQTFRLHLDGLKVGQSYVMVFAKELGTAPQLRVTDVTGGTGTKTLTAPTTYSFTARSTVQDLNIAVGGTQ